MSRKCLIFLIAILCLLSGCAAEPAASAATTVPATTVPILTEPPTESEPAASVAETVVVTEPPLIDIPAGSHACRFTSEATGDYLDYYLFVPQNACAGMPVLVFLHGDGEVGRIEALESYGPILSLRELYGDDFPCIVISPCTRQPSWTNGTIPGTLIELIDDVVAACEADSERIIISGHSRGAIGVWYMISQYGDYFSAAVSVSCGSDRILNYENVSKVPIFAMAGDVGQYENIYRSEMEKLVSRIQAENGTARFVCLEGCGHIDTVTAAYTKELIEWMLEQ